MTAAEQSISNAIIIASLAAAFGFLSAVIQAFGLYILGDIRSRISRLESKEMGFRNGK
jgi:hypothetical protein